jgi:hypothetical protein
MEAFHIDNDHSFEERFKPVYGWLGKVRRFEPQLQGSENTSPFKFARVPYHLEGKVLILPFNWNIPTDLIDKIPLRLKKAINKARYIGSVILTSNIHLEELHAERENADWNKQKDPYYAKVSKTTPMGSRDEPIAQLISAKLQDSPHLQPEMWEWSIKLALGSKWMLKAAYKRWRLTARWVDKVLLNYDIDQNVYDDIFEWWNQRKGEAKSLLRQSEKMCFSWYMLDKDCEGEYGSEFGDAQEAEDFYEPITKPFIEEAWGWDLLCPETMEVWKVNEDGSVVRCIGGPYLLGDKNDKPDLTPEPEGWDRRAEVAKWQMARIPSLTFSAETNDTWDAPTALNSPDGDISNEWEEMEKELKGVGSIEEMIEWVKTLTVDETENVKTAKNDENEWATPYTNEWATLPVASTRAQVSNTPVPDDEW